MYKTEYDWDREIALAMEEIEYMDGFTDQSNQIPLAQAPNEIRKKGWKRGVYVIFNKGNHVYVGQSMQLPDRIGSHRLCLTHLKLPTEPFTVQVFHYPNANENTLKAKERAYRKKYPNDFSHQKDTEMDDFRGADLEQLLVSTNEVLAEISAPMVQGVNRGSSQYIRWIQSSLNQILGISLVIDGIMGPQTRNAIRRFQNLAGLQVDGIVGPKTEAALVSFQRKPGGFGQTIPTSGKRHACPLLRGSHTLIDGVDSYGKDKYTLQSDQLLMYSNILETLWIILQSDCPLTYVKLIGHTSLEGKEEHNKRLGKQRANYLRDILIKDLRTRLIGTGLSFQTADKAIRDKLSFKTESQGENQPVIVLETTEQDRLINRRVAVILSLTP